MNFGQPILVGTLASDPSSAANGMIYYNSTSGTFRMFQGGSFTTIASGGAAANTALSNLSAVAINTSLLPGVDDTINLGSASFSWGSANIHTLNDSGNNVSVDAYNRALVDTAAATQLSWSASGVEFNQLTASTVPYLSAGKILTSSLVTPTELGYVHGVTSAIQTQLNGKADTALDNLASTAVNVDIIPGADNSIHLGSASLRWATIFAEKVDAGSAVLTLNGSSISANSLNITNLATPVNPNDAANKAYVDQFAQGNTWKTLARSATTGALPSYTYANGTAGVGATITATSNAALPAQDGVTLVVNDRLLVKDESGANQPNNGIYVVTQVGDGTHPFILTRAIDNDDASEFTGATVEVGPEATTQAKYLYFQTATSVTVGTTNITWINISQGIAYVFTSGIQISGSTVSAKVDNVTIDVNGSNQLEVKTGGISNTQINAAAAIARSKLASGTVFAWVTNSSGGVMQDTSVTANRAVATDSNGLPVASSTTDTELGFVHGVTSSIQTQINGLATTSLNNLASTAVNVSINPGVDNSISLGTTSLRWQNVAAINVLSGASDLTLNANGGSNSVQLINSGFKRGATSSRYVNQIYTDAITLTGSASGTVASTFTVAFATIYAQEITYTVKDSSSNATRIGTIRVATDGTNTSITDMYTETADVGLSWAAQISGSNLQLTYTTTANNKIMRADTKQFLT